MIHIRAKGQGHRPLGSKVRVETDRQTERRDCITSSANTVGKYGIFDIKATYNH